MMKPHYYKIEFFKVCGNGVVSTVTRFMKITERNQRIAFEAARFSAERHELTEAGWGYGITTIDAIEFVAETS